MKKILWFFKYGWTNSGREKPEDWRGLYGVWPRRGFTFNEGCGPVNFCLFWWPHVFWYCAYRWRGVWYRHSFDWSQP